MHLRMVFALIVGWFCYFEGYDCITDVILKVYWDISGLLFSSFLVYSQLLFWKQSREKGMGLWQWTGKQLFLPFLLKEPILCLYHFCVAAEESCCFSVHLVCVILGFCLKCPMNLCSWEISMWMLCTPYYQRKALMRYLSLLASSIVLEWLPQSAW